MSQGLPIFGTEEADILQGTSDSEDIYGLGGDDFIDGGGGGDELIGGTGNDVYIVGEFDTVVEADGEGDDEVRTAAAAYVLADHVERLTGLSADAQELTGNSLDNIIVGGSNGDVLRGGLGNDSLTGGDGSDIYRFARGDGDDLISVAPGTGHDSLELLDIFVSNVTVSQSGYDLILTIDEGGGSITLLGSGSSFTSLAEIIFGDTTWSNADLLAHSTATAGEGPDTLTGDDNDNVIAGLGGDDVLDGAGGNDSLDGGDGDDILIGGTGDDVLEGGAGSDLLAGNAGNDIFRFARGFGQDVIADSDSSGDQGYDRIDLLDILPDEVTVTAEGETDLIISINGTSDSIRLENVLVNPLAMIALLAFADGTIWNGDYLVYLASPPPFYGTEDDEIVVGGNLTDILYGGGGNDSLSGGKGRDSLAGGLGDDFLSGGEGSDSYAYSAGDGNDVILEYDGSGDGGYDHLFIDGYGRGDTTVGRSSDGLSYILYFGGGDESITLYGAASGDPKYRVEWIDFEYAPLAGATLHLFALDVGNGDDVLTVTAESYNSLAGMRGLGGNDVITGGEYSDWLRGDAGDDSLIGGEGDDNLDGGAGDDLLVGGTGDDVLEGGTGGDRLVGNAGNDIYRFAHGFGQDVIADPDSSGGGGYDTIDLVDILPGEVTVTAEGDTDLIISINGTSDSIRLENVLVDPLATIDLLTFADGTVWSGEYLAYLASPPPFYGTEEDEIVVGGNLLDTLYGGGGNDSLSGGRGRDYLAGGLGDDFLSGGEGVDFYAYSAGDGNDIILEYDGSGDGGNDYLYVYGYGRWDTTIGRSSDGLSYILYFGDGEESITLYGAASGDPKYRVEWINFGTAMLRGVTLGAFALDIGSGDDVVTGAVGSNNSLRGLGGNDVITGGDYFDNLRGDSGDDTLNGGGDQDHLEGGAGDDALNGGDGDDLLSGGAGADLQVGGAGNDIYYVDESGDLIVEAADEGDDEVRSTVAAYILTENVERLTGMSGTGQVLTGNALDNVIYGGNGDDILEGGAGDDQLSGGEGVDVYRFARGDGDDVVTEYWGWGTFNAIEFATGILPDDVSVTQSGSDIVLTVNDDGGSITWRYGGDAPDSFEVRFADGTVWSYAEVMSAPQIGGDEADVLTGNYGNNIIRGLGGDDVLRGDYGDDVVEGGAGSDLLTGGAGDDRYRFERGFGQDEIAEADSSGGWGYDRIEFAGDILPGEVSVYTIDDGRGLLLVLAGTTDRIVIDNALFDPALAIEEVTFANGTVWTAADLLAMAVPAPALANEQFGTAGDDALSGGASDDILHGEEGDDVVHGDEGSDWLQGGLGADFLSGGAGNDYYLYDAGDGHDVIEESAGPGDGGHDTIRIGSGIRREDLTVGRSADGLSYILFFGSGEESITLSGAATAASEYQIEYIRFANGEGMSGADLAALALDVGNGDDFLVLSGESTALRGLGGDDALYGASGNDRLRGDSGNDTLSGGDGDDELDGGAGADLLIGGAGDDVYYVDDPTDAIIEADGEGLDEIRTSVAFLTLPEHVERLIGQSEEAQELIGNALDNVIYGGSGNDILTGGLGNDVLAGGPGSNIYHFTRGDGDDYIIADYYGDVLQFGSDILPGQVTVHQRPGFEVVITIDQGGGSVTLRCDMFLVTGVSQVIFGDGTIWSREELVAKSMIGTESGDWLVGDPSDNVIMGLGGDDVLSASVGNDVLDGGDGDDILIGGWGTHQLTGGAGADRFQFSESETPGPAADRITDFVPGEDRIAISSYGHWPFTFIGSAAFSGAAGELRYAFDGTDTWLQGDYDGDGTADLMIVLTGNMTLSASDFLL